MCILRLFADIDKLWEKLSMGLELRGPRECLVLRVDCALLKRLWSRYVHSLTWLGAFSQAAILGCVVVLVSWIQMIWCLEVVDIHSFWVSNRHLARSVSILPILIRFLSSLMHFIIKISTSLSPILSCNCFFVFCSVCLATICNWSWRWQVWWIKWVVWRWTHF